MNNLIAKKIVIMCDYGLDDAVATVNLISNATKFESIDIIAVGGNTPTALSFLNAKKLLSNLALPLDKVRIIDSSAIPQPSDMDENIHGKDGMGNLYEEKPLSIKTLTIKQWFSEQPEIDLLLSLGPMTVTEIVLNTLKVNRFIFMAGRIKAPANYKGFEFNQGVNEKAFNACAKFKHVAITLDVACPALNVINAPLNDNSVYINCIRAYRDLCIKRGKIDSIIWDDIAMLYILYPHLFIVKPEADDYGNTLNVATYIGPQYPAL